MINGIEDNHNFRVQVPLPGHIILQQAHWVTIQDWIDELVEWAPDSYSAQYQPGQLNIWFKDSEHAALCTLRWA